MAIVTLMLFNFFIYALFMSEEIKPDAILSKVFQSGGRV
jgi:hypothetical protein